MRQFRLEQEEKERKKKEEEENKKKEQEEKERLEQEEKERLEQEEKERLEQEEAENILKAMEELKKLKLEKEENERKKKEEEERIIREKEEEERKKKEEVERIIKEKEEEERKKKEEIERIIREKEEKERKEKEDVWKQYLKEKEEKEERKKKEEEEERKRKEHNKKIELNAENLTNMTKDQILKLIDDTINNKDKDTEIIKPEFNYEQEIQDQVNIQFKINEMRQMEEMQNINKSGNMKLKDQNENISFGDKMKNMVIQQVKEIIKSQEEKPLEKKSPKELKQHIEEQVKIEIANQLKEKKIQKQKAEEKKFTEQNIKEYNNLVGNENYDKSEGGIIFAQVKLNTEEIVESEAHVIELFDLVNNADSSTWTRYYDITGNNMKKLFYYYGEKFCMPIPEVAIGILGKMSLLKGWSESFKGNNFFIKKSFNIVKEVILRWEKDIGLKSNKWERNSYIEITKQLFKANSWTEIGNSCIENSFNYKELLKKINEKQTKFLKGNKLILSLLITNNNKLAKSIEILLHFRISNDETE